MLRTAWLALTIAVLPLAGCATLEGYRAFQRGTQALDRGDTDGAIRELERAAVLAPERSEVYNHLGIAYGAAGRPDEARRAFERAVALDCDNQAAVANLHAAQHRVAAGR